MDTRNIFKIQDLFDSFVAQDSFTREALRTYFTLFKTHATGIYEANQAYGLDVKVPNFPECISENLVKFILQDNGDRSVRCKPSGKGRGDLVSISPDGKPRRIECKAFASVGPTSFGPQQDWDVLYVLDACKWLEDRFVLYEVCLPKTSEEWKNLRVSKERTFSEYGKERPRIGWSALYPQVKAYTRVVFDGVFIF